MSTWKRHLMERPKAPHVSMDEPNEVEQAMIESLSVPEPDTQRQRSLSAPALTISACARYQTPNDT